MDSFPKWEPELSSINTQLRISSRYLTGKNALLVLSQVIFCYVSFASRENGENRNNTIWLLNQFFKILNIFLTKGDKSLIILNIYMHTHVYGKYFHLAYHLNIFMGVSCEFLINYIICNVHHQGTHTYLLKHYHSFVIKTFKIIVWCIKYINCSQSTVQ